MLSILFPTRITFSSLSYFSVYRSAIIFYKVLSSQYKNLGTYLFAIGDQSIMSNNYYHKNQFWWLELQVKGSILFESYRQVIYAQFKGLPTFSGLATSL